MKMPKKDRKLEVVGLVRMLTESQYMVQEPAVQSWPGAFTALVKLFSEPEHLQRSKLDSEDAVVTQIDFEEQAAGYQAAYSRLASSEAGEVDPVGYVKDPQAFVSEKLANFVQQHGERARALMSSADAAIVGPFIQSLRASGVAI
jgi:exportin-2 (importin alpha re-exporter)